MDIINEQTLIHFEILVEMLHFYWAIFCSMSSQLFYQQTPFPPENTFKYNIVIKHNL